MLSVLMGEQLDNKYGDDDDARDVNVVNVNERRGDAAAQRGMDENEMKARLDEARRQVESFSH